MSDAPTLTVSDVPCDAIATMCWQTLAPVLPDALASSPHAPAVIMGVVRVGDPQATRTVYVSVVLLVLLGLLLAGLAIWLFRRTRPEPELLAPLETMHTRGWRKLDPAAQRRSLDESRPAGAMPMKREASAPPVDSSFATVAPVASFDDLSEGTADTDTNAGTDGDDTDDGITIEGEHPVSVDDETTPVQRSTDADAVTAVRDTDGRDPVGDVDSNDNSLDDDSLEDTVPDDTVPDDTVRVDVRRSATIGVEAGEAEFVDVEPVVAQADTDRPDPLGVSPDDADDTGEILDDGGFDVVFERDDEDTVVVGVSEQAGADRDDVAPEVVDPVIEPAVIRPIDPLLAPRPASPDPST